MRSARGAPVWYQLYASPKWEVAEGLVKRAERAGSPVVVVTVDRVAGRNQEDQEQQLRPCRRDRRVGVRQNMNVGDHCGHQDDHEQGEYPQWSAPRSCRR